MIPSIWPRHILFKCNSCSNQGMESAFSEDTLKEAQEGNRQCHYCKKNRKERKGCLLIGNSKELSREIRKVEEKEIKRLCELHYRNEYLCTAHYLFVTEIAHKMLPPFCAICKCSGHLDTDHLTYARRGCEWLRDLQLLCRKCHDRKHNRTPSESSPKATSMVSLIKTFLMNMELNPKTNQWETDHVLGIQRPMGLKPGFSDAKRQEIIDILYLRETGALKHRWDGQGKPTNGNDELSHIWILEDRDLLNFLLKCAREGLLPPV